MELLETFQFFHQVLRKASHSTLSLPFEIEVCVLSAIFQSYNETAEISLMVLKINK